MASPIPVTLVGATGLTGSSTLRNLLTSPTAFAVTALTRRAASATATPPNTYTNRVVSDLNDATTASDPIVPAKGTYISCLGTTRAAVGDDIKKQEAIDLFLNRDLATRAKKDGAGTVSAPVSARLMLIRPFRGSAYYIMLNALQHTDDPRVFDGRKRDQLVRIPQDEGAA